MSERTVEFSSGLSELADDLTRLLVKDFSPVMEKVRARYMSPMAWQAWSRSGLRSHTGELKGAVTPFSGKVSAGIGFRTKRGKDLVLPKVYTHTFGQRRMFKWKKKYMRKNPKRAFGTWVGGRGVSPWGDVPARPFIPSEFPVHMQEPVRDMVREYLLAKFFVKR